MLTEKQIEQLKEGIHLAAVYLRSMRFIEIVNPLGETQVLRVDRDGNHKIIRLHYSHLSPRG